MGAQRPRRAVRGKSTDAGNRANAEEPKAALRDTGTSAMCMARGHFVRPNVGVKRATTAGRQDRAVENVAHHRPGLVACRWRSA